MLDMTVMCMFKSMHHTDQTNVNAKHILPQRLSHFAGLG